MSPTTYEDALQAIAEENGVSIEGSAPVAAPEEAAPDVPEAEGDAEGGMLSTIGSMAGESLKGANDLWKSVGAGIGDAALETKDFLVGEPAEGDKSDFRKDWEERSSGLREQSTHNALAAGITQFSVGMLGAGKLMAPIKGVQKLKAAGKAGRFAYESARGAVAGGVVIDPHEQRLSDLVQEFEVLQNPVTEFLASDPNDSDAMGRLKNMLEGIGMDVALAGTFALGVKAIGLVRRGDRKAAAKVLRQVEADAAAPHDPGVVSPKDAEAVISPAKSEASAVPMAQSAKKGAYTPKVVVEETDTDAIITSAREDFAAIEKFGSREEAMAQGHRFASGNLPWQKLSSTEDVQTLVANTSSSLKTQFDAIKGGAVLKDAKVVSMVKSTADLFGLDPEVVLGTLQRAGANATTMVADMEASYIISRRMFEDVAHLASKIESGLLDDYGGDIIRARQDLTKMHQAAADMMASGASMRAAAGRAVRRNRSDFAITPADIENFSKIPPEQLSKVLASTRGDLKKLRQTVSPSFWRRVTDEGSFLLTNNLLWNWTTHAVNTTTNFYMLAARPTEKWLGALAQGKRGGPIRKQAAKEYAYTLSSIGDAWQSMMDAFLKGDSILSPHTTEYFESGSKVNAPQIGWKPVKDVWDLAYNGIMSANFRQISQAGSKTAGGAYRVGVGLPTRALGAVDEFVKTLRYRAVVQARAAVEASEAGLSGKAHADHIRRALEDSIDLEGRALDGQALSEAKISTFQQDLLPGTLGKSVQNFRHNYPPTAFILPFIKTPVNVLRYAWKMTPGLNLLQTEYRQMLKGSMGSEAQAQAVGQMALGSTAMAAAATLALEGRLTGAGPSDYKQKSNLLATGWQPYSIIFEDEETGEKTYFPVGRFDPIGMVFGMAADLVDMMVLHPNTKEAEKGITAVTVALAKAFSEKTFLMNLNQALRAATEPDKNMGKFLGNLAGNMVPGSSAWKNYVNDDPHLREARTFLDQMMKGMPGYSETLPPRRDSFGEPVWRKRGLSSSDTRDLLDDEHTRIILETGEGVGQAAPNRGNGVDLRDMELSDGRNAYDRYVELSAAPKGAPTLRSALEKLISSPQYDDLVDGPGAVRGTKLNAIVGVVSKYRAAAFKQMLGEYPELRQELLKKQIDVREAVASNRKKGSSKPNDIRGLLDSLGY